MEWAGMGESEEVLVFPRTDKWARLWKNLGGLFKQNKRRYLHNTDVRRSIVGRNAHTKVSASSLMPISLARVLTSPFAISVQSRPSPVRKP